MEREGQVFDTTDLRRVTETNGLREANGHKTFKVIREMEGFREGKSKGREEERG